MARVTWMERQSEKLASRWLDRVRPQVGLTADYAQVDVDTLISIKGKVKANLVAFSVALFECMLRHPALRGAPLSLRLDIPLGRGEGALVYPGCDVLNLLQGVDFTGDLRGRRVPGYTLATVSLGCWNGGISHQNVSLSGLSMGVPGVSAFFYEEIHAESGSKGNVSHREGWVSMFYSPPTKVPREAIYP